MYSHVYTFSKSFTEGTSSHPLSPLCLIIPVVLVNQVFMSLKSLCHNHLDNAHLMHPLWCDLKTTMNLIYEIPLQWSPILSLLASSLSLDITLTSTLSCVPIFLHMSTKTGKVSYQWFLLHLQYHQSMGICVMDRVFLLIICSFPWNVNPLMRRLLSPCKPLWFIFLRWIGRWNVIVTDFSQHLS